MYDDTTYFPDMWLYTEHEDQQSKWRTCIETQHTYENTQWLYISMTGYMEPKDNIHVNCTIIKDQGNIRKDQEDK